MSSLSAFSVPAPATPRAIPGASPDVRQYARGPGAPPADSVAPKPPAQQATPPGGALPPRLLPRGSLVDLSA